MDKPWTLHIEASGPIDNPDTERAIDTFFSQLRSQGHDLKAGTFNVVDKSKDVVRSYAGR